MGKRIFRASRLIVEVQAAVVSARTILLRHDVDRILCRLVRILLMSEFTVLRGAVSARGRLLLTLNDTLLMTAWMLCRAVRLERLERRLLSVAK